MFNMRTACDTAHVKSVLRLLKMLQHVLDNSLQCGGVSLLITCLAQELNCEQPLIIKSNLFKKNFAKIQLTRLSNKNEKLSQKLTKKLSPNTKKQALIITRNKGGNVLNIIKSQLRKKS